MACVGALLGLKTARAANAAEASIKARNAAWLSPLLLDSLDDKLATSKSLNMVAGVGYCSLFCATVTPWMREAPASQGGNSKAMRSVPCKPHELDLGTLAALAATAAATSPAPTLSGADAPEMAAAAVPLSTAPHTERSWPLLLDELAGPRKEAM